MSILGFFLLNFTSCSEQLKDQTKFPKQSFPFISQYQHLMVDLLSKFRDDSQLTHTSLVKVPTHAFKTISGILHTQLLKSILLSLGHYKWASFCFKDGDYVAK